MVKDHSDSERRNLLVPLHGQLFSINSKGSFICTIPSGLSFPISDISKTVVSNALFKNYLNIFLPAV